MNRPAKQHGFALLITLLLVLLLGAVLAGVAWRSMAAAIEAHNAVEEVQRRWAVTSCQATLLERAEDLLCEEEEAEEVEEARRGQGRAAPVAKLRVACELAGRQYELLFMDEQAKLNVNTLLQAAGKAEADANVKAVVAKLSELPDHVSVRIRAEIRAEAVPKGSPAGGTATVEAYGQVFEGASPADLSSGLADAITCWGGGAVSRRRASDAVLEQACGKVLRPSELSELLAARKRDPSCEVTVLLGQLSSINEKQKGQLRGCLTDQSTCHGLWVIARGKQRSWYSLVVGTGTSATSKPVTGDRARRGASGSSAGAPARVPARAPTSQPAERAGRGNPQYRFTW